MVLTLPVAPRSTRHDGASVAGSHLAQVSEAIAADYPAVARALGPGAFESLVARYLVTSPPRSFDLSRVGEPLRGVGGEQRRHDH